MATSYEVRVPLQPQGSAGSLGDVLGHALADAREWTRAPQVEPDPDHDGGLLVRLWLVADDASIAQLAADGAVRTGLAAAGLDETAAAVGPGDVRASS